MTNEKQIRLKVDGESFWAYRYPDLPDNQAEINNHLLTDAYAFGDRVEFDEDRNVIRLVQTRADVLREMGGEMTNEKTTSETITVSREKLKRLVEIADKYCSSYIEHIEIKLNDLGHGSDCVEKHDRESLNFIQQFKKEIGE